MIFRRNFHPFFEHFSPSCHLGVVKKKQKYSEGTDAKHRIRSCSVQHRIKPNPARISNIGYRKSNIDRARLKCAIFVIFMNFVYCSLRGFGRCWFDVPKTSTPGIEEPRPKVGLPVESA
jgi:hypothetical protein